MKDFFLCCLHNLYLESGIIIFEIRKYVAETKIEIIAELMTQDAKIAYWMIRIALHKQYAVYCCLWPIFRRAEHAKKTFHYHLIV